MKIEIIPHIKETKIADLPVGTIYNWNANTWLRVNLGCVVLTTGIYQFYPERDPMFNCVAFEIVGELKVVR